MEEVLPPQTQHGAGFELTRVRQFTVFLENRVGRLTMLMRALEDGDRISAMSIEESADAALIRVICTDPDFGRDALRQSGFSFSESEVLAVELPSPMRSRQPLIAICSALLAAEMTARMKDGVSQANGTFAIEPTMDVENVARAVVYMASLPLDANVLFLTVMATKMPFIGRG